VKSQDPVYSDAHNDGGGRQQH